MTTLDDLVATGDLEVAWDLCEERGRFLPDETPWIWRRCNPNGRAWVGSPPSKPRHQNSTFLTRERLLGRRWNAMPSTACKGYLWSLVETMVETSDGMDLGYPL